MQPPWAKLCKQKYAMNWQEMKLIRMTRQVEGSQVWNRAWENKALVQKHCFWEIKSGKWARFWEDNWQQEGNLRNEELASIQGDTINKGLIRVSDYWNQLRNNTKWRIWKHQVYNEMNTLKAQAKALEDIMEKR